MKKLLVILVILMAVRPAIPFIEYWANYDYIVNELCENKDKPMMHCDGKCHLNKELSQSNNSSDLPELRFQNIIGIPAILPLLFEIPTLGSNTIEMEKSYFHYTDSIGQYINTIEIPPRIIG